jgi:hypothetical protein
LYLVTTPAKRRHGKGSGETPAAWLRFPKRLSAVLAILDLREPDLSQNQLADRCGVNRGSFSEWKNDRGAWEGMTMPVFLRLAEGLGVDPGWLAAGDGDPVWVKTQLREVNKALNAGPVT